MYAIRYNKFYTYLFLLDTLPTGPNWELEIQPFAGWIRGNVKNRQEDHLRDYFSGGETAFYVDITADQIDYIVRTSLKFKKESPQLSQEELSILIRKLYVLNICIFKAQTEEGLEAAQLFGEIQKTTELNSRNQQLLKKLQGFYDRWSFM